MKRVAFRRSKIVLRGRLVASNATRSGGSYREVPAAAGSRQPEQVSSSPNTQVGKPVKTVKTKSSRLAKISSRTSDTDESSFQSENPDLSSYPLQSSTPDKPPRPTIPEVRDNSNGWIEDKASVTDMGDGGGENWATMSWSVIASSMRKNSQEKHAASSKSSEIGKINGTKEFHKVDDIAKHKGIEPFTPQKAEKTRAFGAGMRSGSSAFLSFARLSRELCSSGSESEVDSSPSDSCCVAAPSTKAGEFAVLESSIADAETSRGEERSENGSLRLRDGEGHSQTSKTLSKPEKKKKNKTEKVELHVNATSQSGECRKPDKIHEAGKVTMRGSSGKPAVEEDTCTEPDKKTMQEEYPNTKHEDPMKVQCTEGLINQLEKEAAVCCPVCMEELDSTDRCFFPCLCGYQLCLWCLHHIREHIGNRCPACRREYDEANFIYDKRKEDELNKQSGEPKALRSRDISRGFSPIASPKCNKRNMKAAPSFQTLADVRVIQRTLLYVIGIPPSLAKKEILRKPEYFGQYGKIINVNINRSQAATSVYANPTFSAYITYSSQEEAIAAIQGSDGTVLEEGSVVRASFGTTKYCSYFLRKVKCANPDCFYLHRIGNENDSFTAQEMVTAKHQFHDLTFPVQLIGSRTTPARDIEPPTPPPPPNYPNPNVRSRVEERSSSHSKDAEQSSKPSLRKSFISCREYLRDSDAPNSLNIGSQDLKPSSDNTLESVPLRGRSGDMGSPGPMPSSATSKLRASWASVAAGNAPKPVKKSEASIQNYESEPSVEGADQTATTAVTVTSNLGADDKHFVPKCVPKIIPKVIVPAYRPRDSVIESTPERVTPRPHLVHEPDHVVPPPSEVYESKQSTDLFTPQVKTSLPDVIAPVDDPTVGGLAENGTDAPVDNPDPIRENTESRGQSLLADKPSVEPEARPVETSSETVQQKAGTSPICLPMIQYVEAYLESPADVQFQPTILPPVPSNDLPCSLKSSPPDELEGFDSMTSQANKMQNISCGREREPECDAKESSTILTNVESIDTRERELEQQSSTQNDMSEQAVSLVENCDTTVYEPIQVAPKVLSPNVSPSNRINTYAVHNKSDCRQFPPTDLTYATTTPEKRLSSPRTKSRFGFAENGDNHEEFLFTIPPMDEKLPFGQVAMGAQRNMWHGAVHNEEHSPKKMESPGGINVRRPAGYSENFDRQNFDKPYGNASAYRWEKSSHPSGYYGDKNNRTGRPDPKYTNAKPTVILNPLGLVPPRHNMQQGGGSPPISVIPQKNPHFHNNPPRQGPTTNRNTEGIDFLKSLFPHVNVSVAHTDWQWRAVRPDDSPNPSGPSPCEQADTFAAKEPCESSTRPTEDMANVTNPNKPPMWIR